VSSSRLKADQKLESRAEARIAVGSGRKCEIEIARQQKGAGRQK